jgi:hypothetical protein
MKKALRFLLLLILIITAGACDSLEEGSRDEGPESDLERVDESTTSGFGAIIFCEDISEDGLISGASNTFPVETGVVWAYFNYWGMEKGQPWGRLWMHNGGVFIDGRGDFWQDPEDGWVAYSVGGEYELEPGEYELTLFLGDKPVRRASFQIVE